MTPAAPARAAKAPRGGAYSSAPMRLAIESAAAGRFDEAVEAVALARGKSYRVERGLVPRLDPKGDLIYSPLWRGRRDGPADRRALRAAGPGLRGRDLPGPLVMLRGLLRFYTGSLTAADADFVEAVRRSPDCAWGHVLLFACRTLLARKRRRFFDSLDAAADLDRAVALDSKHVFALALRAELRHDRDMYAEALADLKRILRIDSRCAWAYAERGDIRTDTGDLRGAFSDFDRLVRLSPGQAWAYALRARANANANRPAAARRDFDRAIRLDPKGGAVRAWRAEARRKSGDVKGAFADFDRAIRLAPEYTLAFAWRGRARLQAGLLEEALSDLDRAVRLDPRHVLLHSWRGETLFKLGRMRSALDSFDRAFPFHPRHSWNPPLKGRSTREEAMLASLDDAVRRRPRSPYAWTVRGRILIDSPSRSEGLEDLRRALRLDPSCVPARAWLGEGLRRDGRLPEAIEQLDRAVAAGEAAFWPRLWRGRALLDAGDYDGAVKDFDAAALRRPDDAFTLKWRGAARLRAGRSAEAVLDLERSCLLSAKDGEAAALLSDARRASRAGAAR
ncbi:MAG: tetratricopeptide repeat protein [Elusimicrobiota bacterium]